MLFAPDHRSHFYTTIWKHPVYSSPYEEYDIFFKYKKILTPQTYLYETLALEHVPTFFHRNYDITCVLLATLPDFTENTKIRSWTCPYIFSPKSWHNPYVSRHIIKFFKTYHKLIVLSGFIQKIRSSFPHIFSSWIGHPVCSAPLCQIIKKMHQTHYAYTYS